MDGKFITVEGIDGAGKTTQIEFISSWLKKQGINALLTHEPGGTPLGGALRDILLGDNRITPEAETLLMFASRHQLVEDVIRPILSVGDWVVSDRFTDSTFAYQGGGRCVYRGWIHNLSLDIEQEIKPDLTLLLDVNPLITFRRKEERGLDRFEKESLDFYYRVREAYLKRAKEYPSRIKVIDASKGQGYVRESIEEALVTFLSRHLNN